MIEIIENIYAGITFGGNEPFDFMDDYYICEQLYAQMMQWA